MRLKILARNICEYFKIASDSELIHLILIFMDDDDALRDFKVILKNSVQV